MPELADVRSGHLLLPIGEPVSVSSPLILDIHKKSRNNVLLAGNNATVITGLEKVIRRGLAVNRDVDVYLIDGEMMIGALTDEMNIGPSVVRSALTDEDVISIIDEVHSIMSDRKGSSWDHRFVCLYISDLQWNELIKKMMRGDRVYARDYIKNPKPSTDHDDTVTSKLLSIIRGGNKYGIFTIITTKHPGDAVDLMRYQEQLLKEMGHRVASSLTERESDAILGMGISCICDDHVAYYSDGVGPASLFKPYHVGDNS
jgi:hypothetical protein